MPKRTLQPKKAKRAKKHGFRIRMRQAQQILKRRRNKGRASISA